MRRWAHTGLWRHEIYWLLCGWNDNTQTHLLNQEPSWHAWWLKYIQYTLGQIVIEDLFPKGPGPFISCVSFPGNEQLYQWDHRMCSPAVWRLILGSDQYLGSYSSLTFTWYFISARRNSESKSKTGIHLVCLGPGYVFPILETRSQ